MQLTIALRKEVADEVEAQGLYDFVVDKMLAHPDVVITASTSSQLKPKPEPE